MLFNSLTFLGFFGVVLCAYRLIRSWFWQKRLLLAASYVFYGAWNPPYTLILIFSTALDFYLAKWIYNCRDERFRRYILIISILANLGLLGFFKYADFLLENFKVLAGLAGIDYRPPQFGLILPIGISFYTFASLSYTIDVYRRDIDANWRFADYALFVSFFPHLVAGPIVRASVLLPQMVAPRVMTPNRVGWGLALFVFGIASKVVLADGIFAPVVNKVYENPWAFGALDTGAAVLAFSGQIYYDFSGYSLCAIGIALCFGFEFPDNFRQPYAARTLSEFWRRWHISLSTWLRDYLYIPLGGNRGGSSRTHVNLLLTMLIGGFWHGASWMFVLWGGLHGFYLALERVFLKPGKAAREISGLAGLGAAATVFAFVSLTWIPFRAADWIGMAGIISAPMRWELGTKLDPFSTLLVFVAVLATLVWQNCNRDTRVETRFAGFGTVGQSAALAACMILIFLYSGGERHAFIYFQF